MKKVSIILTNYCPDNEVHGYLMDFLKSLQENTDRNLYQFVVVENGSFTQELKDQADIYIHRDYPMGNARAANLGLALAEGELLIIANNDLVLPPKWLETMLEDYRDGTLSPLDTGWIDPEPRIYENAHWFALVLMNRKTFSKVGYLDESLPHRFHDQDYSIRVKKAGFPVRRTGRVIVKHINMATFNKMGRPNEDKERDEMIKRYNAATFDDWAKQ